MRAEFTAQFKETSVEVVCEICGESIGIPNATTKRMMDNLIIKFRKSHEKAHKGEDEPK